MEDVSLGRGAAEQSPPSTPGVPAGAPHCPGTGTQPRLAGSPSSSARDTEPGGHLAWSLLGWSALIECFHRETRCLGGSQRSRGASRSWRGPRRQERKLGLKSAPTAALPHLLVNSLSRSPASPRAPSQPRAGQGGGSSGRAGGLLLAWPGTPRWSQLGPKGAGSSSAISCPSQGSDGARSSPAVIRVTFRGCGCQHQPFALRNRCNQAAEPIYHSHLAARKRTGDCVIALLGIRS